MKSILEKGDTYKDQCQQIREVVIRFGREHSCESISRGRRGHASLACVIGKYRGVIDVQMELHDWDQMPDDIPDDYPFELWCAASSGPELFSVEQIYWELPFHAVESHVQIFLNRCWDFLSTLTDGDFTDRLPEPSCAPDRLPSLGGPKPREFKGEHSRVHGCEERANQCPRG